MMACTSPACTVRSMPRRMGLPSTATCRFLMVSIRAPLSTDRPFETDTQQLLRFHRELHRQFLEHLHAEAVDDHRHRVLRREAAALAVIELVFTDARGRGLVLDPGGGVLHLDVGEGVSGALVAQQQRVTLRVVASADGALRDLYLPAVGVASMAGRDALGEDRASGVPAE